MREVFYKEILPLLQRPSQYLGTERNAVHKDPRQVELRVGLIFPDLYDLGLGNLGVHILYSILNGLPWCWAERAYAPAPDLEQALRERNLPLFALESKTPLSQLDLLGFSLQSELTYTSVLNILDLSGVPLRARDRGESHPIVIAGGPAAANPEPVAPFFDAIVIGDGEEAILEILECVRANKSGTRREKIHKLTQIDGVYVPEFNQSSTIRRRMVRNLDLMQYPTDYIVPYTQLVHDRIGLEIMRGCTHGCRFCQAGITGRPVRMRSVERLDQLMDRLIDNTGYDEVSLVSLSTCDYPRIRSLLSHATARASRDSIAVSVPSLRLDTFSVELADAISGPRRSGLTFAPEAATPRLRRLINKWCEDEDLLTIAEEAFRRGWGHVKLYFMIGIPTETDEDVEAIADLCLRVLERGRSVTRRAKVFTGISTFVPKPHTPLQWAQQIVPDEIRRRHAILERRFGRNPGIKFGRHEPESSFIEGLLSRAGQDGADLIEAAYRRGARLDSSSEMLKAEAWLQAIEDVQYDVDAALRARRLDETLPWDHIDVGVPKQWLLAEWRRAAEGELTEDCRVAGCRMCGVRNNAAEPCAAMLRASKEPDEALEVPAKPVEPEPAQRVRFRIGRTGEPRFLSHLEFATAWIRALHRAHAPLSFSQGFHQHPKVTFSTAMPLGEESEAEYMDVVLRERVVPGEMLAALQKTLPPGFHAYEAQEVSLRAPSLMQSVAGHDYILQVAGDTYDIAARVAAVNTATSLDVERKGRPEGRRKKKQTKEIDIRPMVSDLAVESTQGGTVKIRFATRIHDGRLAKPKDILALLGIDHVSARTIKVKTILAK